MISQFRSTEKAVLFGLKTFWEGVDIQGEALSLVVIDKFPFPVPTDPVVEGRQTYLKQLGHEPFMEYNVPTVTISLKQGVGRLIRSHHDRGVMAILDRRLHTKGYGQLILSCLPPARRTQWIEDVRQFFS
jgi:ATP-dependent DNA helicase DinG